MILAISKERLDIKCDQYERILCSIVDGLKDYQKSVPLASGTKMYQIFCKDVLIDYECNIKFQRRPIHTDFVSYEHYYNSLLEVCKKIRDNGQDTLRKNKYGLITTVSSGYDSSAASAIAYELGCKTACTFCGGNYDADSGIEVAKQLGYKKIIQKSGNEYKSKSSMTDARCVCNGDMGSNLQFTAFEDVFAGNIVFVGICGDTVYSKDAIPNTDLKRYGVPFYQANMSYIETALADGYIVLPMPLYALTAHASIQRITNSKEMEPWTLHNTYDRPIPRRICETHGVERTVFGNEKHGAGISLSRNFTRKQIKSKLTVSGYEEFMEWLSKKGNNTWHFKRIVHLLKYHYCILPEYIDYLKAKLHLKCKGHSYNKRANLYANPGLPSRLVIWGIEKITSDYRVVIKK